MAESSAPRAMPARFGDRFVDTAVSPPMTTIDKRRVVEESCWRAQVQVLPGASRASADGPGEALHSAPALQFAWRSSSPTNVAKGLFGGAATEARRRRGASR